tara:strand:- start:226 stop:945 length:720 start_codon:yes stop_codon:yes gene_type:complete
MKKETIPPELIKLLTSDEIMMFSELQIKIQELNDKTNLTRLTDGLDYWISQVYDSIWIFKDKNYNNLNKKKFIDIGSGCGFPGLAYAILHPDSEIYLVDSSKKKADSLSKIINSINFHNNLYVINDRIENIGHHSSFRNSFNIATARAVSNPSTVSEYILPILKEKGIGILYCGKWDHENNKTLVSSLEILGGKIIEIKNISLPMGKGSRNVIFIKPDRLCPEIYPRRVGKPEKYPLKG